MSDRTKLANRIKAVDFALYELVLYLDAYPCDQRALSYYAKYKKMAEMLKVEYNQKYGPLTAFENGDPHRWQWVEGPWPWEKEAN
jgi:spore coat protein JB